jgi:hypothetical protein
MAVLLNNLEMACFARLYPFIPIAPIYYNFGTFSQMCRKQYVL